MKLSKFDDYIKFESSDPNNFKKRVGFTQSNSLDLFETLDLSNNIPIIVWGNNTNIDENQLTNLGIPSIKQIYSTIKTSPLFPNRTSDRAQVKKLKFPIIAESDTGSEEFKTFGKFKKSTNYFNYFTEKITPGSTFNLICYQNTPLHLEEKINDLGFDVNLNQFKYLPKIEMFISEFYSKFKIDYYNVVLVESSNGIYLTGVNNSINLGPTQLVKMYENAYQKHYMRTLPTWFKKLIYEEHAVPYYKKRYYDSLLLKPKYSIDFKKFI